MATATHIYKILIEYNDNPNFHPIAVMVKRNSSEIIAEHNGKNLKSLLHQANTTIIESEQEEGMI